MLFYILILMIMLISIYSILNKDKPKSENYCNLDIDNTKIIRRGKSYEKMINNLVDTKKGLFNEQEIDIMKNKNQYYDITDKNNIKNISQKVYGDCKGKYSTALHDYENISDEDKNKLISMPNLYEKIVNNLDEEISYASSYKDKNIPVLENEEYLRDYYFDIFGNKINSDLKDYFANYYLTIDNKYGEEPKEAIKVKVTEGNSDFIIPNQYNRTKHMTNAYNVDWTRIINPMTYY